MSESRPLDWRWSTAGPLWTYAHTGRQALGVLVPSDLQDERRTARQSERAGRPIIADSSVFEPGRLVSVIVGLLFEYKGEPRWLVKPVPGERRQVALVARLNDRNDVIKDFFVIPPVRSSRSLVISENNVRLQHNFRLGDLADFFEAVQTVARSVQT